MQVGKDGKMSQLVPLEELFKGRHFDQEIVGDRAKAGAKRRVIVVRSLPLLSGRDTRTGTLSGTRHSALGFVPAGVGVLPSDSTAWAVFSPCVGSPPDSPLIPQTMW